MKAKKGEAKSVLVDAPEFRSEAEEAKWWDRHRDLIADLLLKHGRRGSLAPCCGFRPFRATIVSD
jgi:hypothetical protein